MLSLSPAALLWLLSLHPADRLKEKASHDIGVDIRTRTSIFEVSAPFLSDMERNPDGSSTIAHTPSKLSVGTRLVVTSETKLNTVTVARNVMLVASAKLLASFLDSINSLQFTHSLCREVSVRASPV